MAPVAAWGESEVCQALPGTPCPLGPATPLCSWAQQLPPRAASAGSSPLESLTSPPVPRWALVCWALAPHAPNSHQSKLPPRSCGVSQGCATPKAAQPGRDNAHEAMLLREESATALTQAAPHCRLPRPGDRQSSQQPATGRAGDMARSQPRSGQDSRTEVHTQPPSLALLLLPPAAPQAGWAPSRDGPKQCPPGPQQAAPTFTSFFFLRSPSFQMCVPAHHRFL